jgi:hypothetical protein
VIGLILGGIVAVIAVAIVALPFLRDSGEPEFLDTAESAGRLELMEVRDRAVGALKELEFDHRTGKVDDVDYRALVGPLRRAVADSLQALDRGKAPAAAVQEAPSPNGEEASANGTEESSAEEGLPEQEQVQRDD